MTALELATLAISIATPLVITILGYLFNQRLKQLDVENHRRNQLYEEEKQRQKNELERKYEPHIELTIEVNFFGPQKGAYIAEFVIHAHNKSLIRHEFKRIDLRVRGIKTEEEPTIWKKYKPRLLFPHKPLETNVVPENLSFLFIEPSVRQQITFVTRIDSEYAYILAGLNFTIASTRTTS